MRKIHFIFVLFILSLQSFGQKKKLANFSYVAYGEYFNRYVDGQREGLWIETKNGIAQVGNYRKNKRDSIWQYYNINTGELLKEKRYLNDKGEIRRIRAKFFGDIINFPKDTFIHVNFTFYDKSISKNLGTLQLSPKLSDVTITVVNERDTSNKDIKVTDKTIFLSKYKTYKIMFSKRGYITKEIIINTNIPKLATKKQADTISDQYFEVNLSNKVPENDPKILGKASNVYRFSINNDRLQMFPDNWYLALQKRKLNQLDEYEKKRKILEIENSVNEQIISLKQEQILLESEKKLKEEELRHQEDEVKRKQLELELLAKDKAVSDLTIKAKEAELLRNMLLANEKKKEIEKLNQQKIIDELNIKNKEVEIAKQDLEAENKLKQISGLEKEKELSNENLKQQLFIQKLMLAGSGLLILFLVFVFFSLYKSRKATKFIAQQKLEVEKQKESVIEKNKEIEEKQKEILDSIIYARRIQRSLLPTEKYINRNLPKT